MATLCPKCGFENPANFNFCGNCGARLSATPSRVPLANDRQRLATTVPDALAQKISSVGKQIEGERRVVTVLFSDISGFTAIAERLDPEQVYDLIDSTLKAFIAEIYRHEGTIDKILGDGVMALFGAPIAHEDDPARAVRAALGMQDAVRRINADLEARLGISLRVRIGLHSGTVVVGSIGSDLRMEYTALGDTVNVAARLQTAAEPGTILVSRAVYEPTRALFEFRELGALRVKNRVEPVDIFEVTAPRAIAGRVRGIPGLSAPMVGRQEELARLRQIVDMLTTRRYGHIVLVTGNAGIGKSRLTAELKGYLADKWATVLEGACLAYGQPTYGVFLQILRALFGIAENDSEETAREKIERTISALLPASHTQVLPYIEHLLSIRIFDKELLARLRHLAPAQLQQQTFLAIQALLTAQAQTQPLVLIFEDIHWIDSLSLELLTFLLREVEQAPLLFYCNSRPDEGRAAEKIQRLGSDLYSDRFTHLPLAPLTHADSIALVDLLLTIHNLPETLKQLIPQRAEGNPFYLEEIIRMLIDRGIIRRGAEHWEMTPGAPLDDLQVPATLQGLILARVDHLSESARQALQCAAVIGRDFSYQLLESVVEGAPHLAEDVQALEERQLIARVDHAAEYRFNHILIQDTVYHSLLRRRREYLHHKIAGAIETLFRDRLEDHLAELAFHYTESQDLDRALPYQIRAGKHAEERFANEQARRHYQLAANFLTRTTPSVRQRIDVYRGLGAVQTLTGDYAGATTAYLIALEVVHSAARTLETTREGAEIMRAIGRVCERRGDYVEALRWLENALKELENDPDPHSLERVRLYNDIGWVQYRRGEFDQAYEWRMKTLRIVEGTEHYNEMASAYNGLVVLFTRRGDWARATAYAEKALRLREMIGDLRGVSQSLTNLGSITGEMGEWPKSLSYLERSLAIRQRIGDIEGIALLNNNLSLLYRARGDYTRARELGQNALEIAEKIKHRNAHCVALINLAALALLQNEYDGAMLYLTPAIDLAKTMGSKEKLAEAHTLLAEAYAGKGESESAAQAARAAMTTAVEIGNKEIQGRAWRVLARLACDQRDFQTASDALERSLTLLSELNSPFELAQSRLQLAQLHIQREQFDQARGALEQALEMFTRLGAEAERARTQAELERLTKASTPQR